MGPNLGDLSGRCDLLILAGDIDLGTRSVDYAAALRQWLDVRVVLIAGNHEFYGFDQGQLVIDLRAAVSRHEGIHFLENDCLEMTVSGHRLRLLGCTLWTDFALFGFDRRSDSLAAARRRMTDFDGTIRLAATGVFQPEDAKSLHQQSLDWLGGELDRAFAGPTVVVSHHAPSFRSVPKEFRKDLTSAAYASNLDDLIVSRSPDVWIHGHMHRSFDYRMDETRIVCNPRGYRPFELNKRFNSGLVVEV